MNHVPTTGAFSTERKIGVKPKDDNINLYIGIGLGVGVGILAAGVYIYKRWFKKNKIVKYSCNADGEKCNCKKHIPNSQKGPHHVDLSNGEAVYICRCGKSSNFPYCDGSHDIVNSQEGTRYSPLKVTREEVGKNEVWVCGCGHSKNLEKDNPYCDGTHKKLVKENEN